MVEKIIFQVFWDSAFGGKLFTAYNAEKKTEFIDNTTLLLIHHLIIS